MSLTADALAMLSAASPVRRFGRQLWPHHRAFYELATRLRPGGALYRRTTHWEFAPSDDGLYSVRDLGPVLWHLSAEGWLQRTGGAFEISEEMRAHGRRLLRQLSPDDRETLRACARQWTTWAKMASKNSV